MPVLQLEAPSLAYPIFIGPALLHETGSYLSSRLGRRTCVILTDHTIHPLYLTILETSLSQANHTLLPSILLPPGEENKSFDGLRFILTSLFSSIIDRSTVFITLGGGVIGDIGGLAASIALRGLPLIHIPTTLLAQVDSAIGGKTAINTPYGKNQIGTFYLPHFVLIDTDTLSTLPSRYLKAGYAEILKYALIQDREFFLWLENNAQDLLKRDPDALSYAIHKSCHIKAEITSLDPFDTSSRALLNLGHTFAHALETLNLYSLTHGHAVSLGLALAFRFSYHLNLIPRQTLTRLLAHLDALALPYTPQDLPIPLEPHHAQTLVSLMSRDKKNLNNSLTLILVKGIGEAFIQRDIPPQRLAVFLERWISDHSSVL